MRQVRLALYFVVGVLLGSLAVIAKAETIPSTAGNFWQASTHNGYKYASSALEACQAVQIYANPGTIDSKHSSITVGATPDYYGGLSCHSLNSNWGYPLTPQTYGPVYPVTQPTCPAGQNWTLTGSTCTRPDCVSPQTMQSDGTCKAPACPAGQHVDPADPAKCQPDCIGDQIQQSDGTCKCAMTGAKTVSYVVPPGGVGSYASDCLNNCKQSISSAGFCPAGVVTAFTGGSTTCYTRATPTGATCNSVTGVPMPPLKVTVAPPPSPPDTTGTAKDNVTPDAKNTPDNNKDPVACGAAGGSYGTYNGVGKCLTPSATDQVAKVADSSSTVTNSDGSTVKTTTKTIQTQAGPDSPGTTEVITSKETCVAGNCSTSTSNKITQSPSTTSPGGGAGSGWSASSGTGTGGGIGGDGGEDQGDCTLEPNAPYCKIGTPKAQGEFTSQTSKVATAKQAYQDKLNAITNEIKSIFGTIATGSGSLPCPPPVVLHGKSISFCASDFNDQLSPIAAGVLLIAAFASVMIIFRV